MLSVFVHLAYDKDAERWRAAKECGSLVGRNDSTPYGYGRAQTMGCRVTFSRSYPENVIRRVLRLGTRVVLGFDFFHALAQAEEIRRADVVWTHTESQFLAVAALLAARPSRAKLIGQSVWLFDKWPRYSRLKKALYRRLIERVDVLTTLSPDNADLARGLFPEKRVEFVHFGIPSDDPSPPPDSVPTPFHVVAVGNDRHRDWKTLLAAVNPMHDLAVHVVSQTASKHRHLARGHVKIEAARTNAELDAAYARAAVAVVPLVDNAHASGITAIEEAILAGVPVVATDVGGLRAYFGDEEIFFVPVGDAEALRIAIRHAVDDREASVVRVRRAQARLLAGPANQDAYIRRHVELSCELLGRGDAATHAKVDAGGALSASGA